MSNARKVLMIFAVLVFSTSSLFAQLGAVSDDAEVLINIKPALSIMASGSVDFGDVLMTETGTKSVAPEDGATFTVTGHNSGNILITFPEVLALSNGTETIDFDPFVESTPGSAYTSNATVENGDYEPMTAATGELYLWLGGDIVVTGAAQGDYTGTFAITVAY